MSNQNTNSQISNILNQEMTDNQVKIGQINAMRSATVMLELRKVAIDQKLDILCVQEPYTNKGEIRGLPHNWRVITTGDHPMAAIIVVIEILWLQN